MGFKGLASSKLIYAHEMGIDVEIDILHEIYEVFMDECMRVTVSYSNGM